VDKGFENMAYGLLGLPHAGITRNICPSCGEDRVALRMALKETTWVNWPSGIGGFTGKSDVALKAEAIILKCDLCQEYFYGSER